MPKPRTDRFCTRIDVCVGNDLNEAIEKFRAEQRLKGEKLKKAEAAERYFEQLHSNNK